MIEIRTISVKNFRSFTDAQFAPLGAGQGVTAVNGANGVGKSSIATHALLWALYGVTPGGVPVKALRQENSEGDVEVCVEFTHDGQTICVTRALRGKKDTTTAAITVDGVEQTNVSSRTATAWVTQRLQANAEAFTAAFVVRQKELDALVRARPAERRAVVERLAGIDRMSEALARARETARHHKTVADNIHVPIPEKDARRELEHARETLEDATEALQQARSEQERLVEVAQHATSEHSRIQQARRAWMSAEEALHEAKRRHTSATEAWQTAERDAADADMLADLQAALEDLREQRDTHQETVRRVTSVEERLERASAEKTALRGRFEEKTRELTRAATAHQQAHDAADQCPAVTAGEHEHAASAEQQAREKVGAAAAEEKRLQRALVMLTDHSTDTPHEAGGSAREAHTCPTCQQAVQDVAGLRELLTEQHAAAQQRRSEAEHALADASDELASMRAAAQQHENTQRALQSARDALTRAQAAADEVEQDLLVAGQIVRELGDELTSVRAAADDARIELQRLAEQEPDVSKALRRAEAADEIAARLPALKAAAKAADAALADAREESDKHTPVTVDDVSAAEQQARACEKELSEATAAVTRAEAREEITSTDVAAKQQVWETAKANEEAKSVALLEAEQAAAVSAALDDFRRDRIARLAPELSETASDLLQTMTEGRFSTVELDEDFTPIVTEASSGEQRPVAWLSGGEESAVALALRLAIGEVVTGQKVGLLVLDEVLTAQDAARRAAVMGAIRSIPHRQVIVINHISEATDMVDLVAWVQRDSDGDVTIEHAAVEPASSDLTHID